MLGLAQSAMTNGHDVMAVVEKTKIQRIEVPKM